MDNRINLFNILKEEGKLITILVYPSQEVENDPFEHTTTMNFLNPQPIKAFVSALSFESLKWKYYGQMPMGSKQIICEKKWYNLLKIADKIKIGNNLYRTYKDDSKGFAIIERENYLVVILERDING